MAAPKLATVKYIDALERIIAAGPEMRSALQGLVDDVADDAAGRAPTKTGEGADSIRGDVFPIPGGWEGRVSWTKRHYYMLMHEKGWVFKPTTTPFLRPALERRREIR